METLRIARWLIVMASVGSCIWQVSYFCCDARRQHPPVPQRTCQDVLDELNNPATQMSGIIDVANSLSVPPACPGILERMTIPVLDVGNSMCFAASDGNLEFLRFMIAAGIDPDSRTDRTMMTPLMCAVSDDQLPSAQLLLDAGANVDTIWEEWSKDGEITYWTAREVAEEWSDNPEVRALFGLPPKQPPPPPRKPIVLFDGCRRSDSSR